MSRNLTKTSCDNCGSFDIDLLEKQRQITKEDAFSYFEEYEGLLVANAVCGTCEAKYLAWCDDRFRIRGYRRREPDLGQKFFDLSYRSSFNDEPGDDDLTEVSRNYKDKRREYAATEADGLREQLGLVLRARDNLSTQLDELKAAKKAAGKRAGAEIQRLRKITQALLSGTALEAKYALGARVVKAGGDYTFEGYVRGHAVKASGAIRYVVEDDRGILMIYSDAQLAAVEPVAVERCKEAELHDADPNCDGVVEHARGGGVHCNKCRGWCCL